MRSPRDVMLSLRWYLVDVLAPVPPMLEIGWGVETWTPVGRGVKGAFEVTEVQWAWLCSLFSVTEIVMTDGDYAWTQRQLMADPHTEAALMGMPLPDTGAAASYGFTPPVVWEIRESADKGMMTLPMALVLRTGDVTPTGSARRADYSFPVEIQCYPVPLDTVDESLASAEDVEERLHYGFRLQGVGLGKPLRLPLWDFDGVNVEESVSFFRYEHDFVRLSGFSTSLVPEEDRRQIRVVVSMTASWSRKALVPTGRIVQEVLQNPRGMR